MPLTLPNLDDRSYADLLAEARALIPALAPGWTDHNPADPGITLVELFAWLTEMLLYRLNQVTDENRLAFLTLINGPAWRQRLIDSPEWERDRKTKLAEEIGNTVLDLRKPSRAVTAEDFECLALDVPEVARAYCVPRRALELGDRTARNSDRPADVSVIILLKPDMPAAGVSPGLAASPVAAVLPFLQVVRDKLEPARLLTTRLHVVAPRRVAIAADLTVRDRGGVIWRRMAPPSAPRPPIGLTLTVNGRDDVPGRLLLEQAEEALRKFLDPYKGGPDGRGWPFGRAVHISEIYDRLARLPQVDHVTPTGNQDELAAAAVEAWRLSNNKAGELAAIALDPDELPKLEIPPGDITVTVPRQA